MPPLSPPRRASRDLGGLAAVVVVWFIAVNAWGPLVAIREARGEEATPGARRVAGCLLVLAAVLTVAVGSALARRRLWAVTVVLAPLGAASFLGWLLLLGVVFGNGLQSVVAVGLFVVPMLVLVFMLLALGWPLGRIRRLSARPVVAKSVR